MLLRRTEDGLEITANDGCRLRELLHPQRDTSGVPYSLAVAWIDPGQATLPHRLLEQTEVYYVVQGQGTLHAAGESRDVRPGDAIVVPAGAEQWIECRGEARLQFLNIVSPPWRADHDVRTRPDGERDGPP